MKKILIRHSWIFLFVLFAKNIFAQQSEMLFLDSCYSQARNNYPLIRQYDLIEKAKEFTIRNANKAWLPQLSITGIGGYVFGGLPELGPSTGSESSNNFKFIGLGQLNQTLWDGGATKMQKQIAESQSGVDKANTDIQLYTLRERVNQVFFGILLLDEQLKQADIQLDMLNRNVNKVQLLHQNGLALKTELNEIKAEVLKVKQKRIEFEYSRSGYIYMLSLLTGKPLNDSVKLSRPVISISPDAKITRPELSLFQSQRNLIEAQSTIDKVRLMPKVGLLGAGVLIAPPMQLGREEKSGLALAGLSVSWDIGGLYSNSNNKNLRQIRIDQIQSQEDAFIFNNNIQSKQQNTEIEKCRTLLISDDEIVSLRTSIRESYQVQYDNGNCPLNDVLTATDKESDARSNKSLHEIQLLLAIHQFKTTKGF